MTIQVNHSSVDVQFPAYGVAGLVVSHDRRACYAVLVPVTSGEGGTLVPNPSCGDYVRVAADGMQKEKTRGDIWTLTIDATRLDFARDVFAGVVVVLVVYPTYETFGPGIPPQVCEKIASLLSQSGGLEVGHRLKQFFIPVPDAPVNRPGNEHDA